jgi:hypothetical protein
MDPDWLNGRAVNRMCEVDSPLAKIAGRGICDHLPNQSLGIFAVLGESLALPLMILPITRLLGWSLFALVTLGAYFLEAIWPTTTGMLIVQFFFFNAEWLNRFHVPRPGQPSESESFSQTRDPHSNP